MDKWKIAIKLVAKCTSEHGLIDFKIVFLMLLSSGNVAANLRRGVFCVDDPAQGAALYRYSSWDHVRTYLVTVEKSMRPWQVTFLEDCKYIMSGSDHGVMYIFDWRSGKMVTKIDGGKGCIQTLTVCLYIRTTLWSLNIIITGSWTLGKTGYILCNILCWHRRGMYHFCMAEEDRHAQR